MWLSKIYSMRPKLPKLKHLDQAEKLDSEVEKTIPQARIHQNSNKIEEADELMNKLIEEAGDDYRILHTAGLFYYESGTV